MLETKFWFIQLNQSSAIRPDIVFEDCVRYFLKTYDTSSLKILMKLQLQPMFVCVNITRKLKLLVAMFHASLHLLLEAKRGQ